MGEKRGMDMKNILGEESSFGFAKSWKWEERRVASSFFRQLDRQQHCLPRQEEGRKWVGLSMEISSNLDSNFSMLQISCPVFFSSNLQ